MANYYHDEQVTKQKFSREWKLEQNKLRSKVRIEDMFDWEVPNMAHIKYNKNKADGFVQITQQSSHSSVTLTRPKQWVKKNKAVSEIKVDTTKSPLRYIGGVDISFTKPGAYEYDKACAGLVIYEWPSMKKVHQETKIVTLKHPYIAGFLAFREVSHLIELVKKVKKTKFVPQVIIVDGNGILHYRRVGLATHFSLAINIPCIGVAKKLLAIDNLNVEYLVPHFNQKLSKIGRFSDIYGYNDEHVGYALKTHLGEDVIYVSPGHMISFETSLKIVMLCVDRRYKLPLPTEMADYETRQIIYRYQRGNRNRYQYQRENTNRYQSNNARPYHSKRGDAGGRPKSNVMSKSKKQATNQPMSNSAKRRARKRNKEHHVQGS